MSAPQTRSTDITIEPTSKGKYKKDVERIELSEDVSLTLLNSAARVIQVMRGANFFLVCHISGGKAMLSACHDESDYEAEACGTELVAGEVAVVNGTFRFVGNEAFTLAIVAFKGTEPTEPHMVQVMRNIAKRLVGVTAMLAYSAEQQGSDFTPFDLGHMFLKMPIGKYKLLTIDTAGTQAVSYTREGQKYGGVPRGNVVISEKTQFSTVHFLPGIVAIAVAQTPAAQPRAVGPLSVIRWAEKLAETNKPHTAFYKNDSTEVTLNSLEIGGSIPAEVHNDVDQLIMVIEGRALVIIGNASTTPDTYQVAAGNSITVPVHTRHEVRQFGPQKLKFVSVYAKAI